MAAKIALAIAGGLYRRPPTRSMASAGASYTEYRIVDSVEETVARLREYAQAGCDRVMIIHPMPWDTESVQLSGRQLIPRLNDAA